MGGGVKKKEKKKIFPAATSFLFFLRNCVKKINQGRNSIRENFTTVSKRHFGQQWKTRVSPNKEIFFWKIPLPLAFFGFGILLKFFVAVATLEQKVCGSQKQGGVENFFLSIFSIFLLGLVQNFCATVRLIPEKIEMSPHV